MKYALLIYVAPDAPRAEVTDPEVFDSWVDYTRELRDSGGLLGAEQLQVTDSATTVRRRDGQRLLTDGPFAETKEHLLGFYLIDVPDLDTALDWAARMPLIGHGSVEVRPVGEGAEWRKILP